MTPNSPRKQQFKLFIGFLVSFAVLFITLGFVILTLYRSATYHGIDRNLQQEKKAILAAQQKPNQTMPNIHLAKKPKPMLKQRQTTTVSPFQMSSLVFSPTGVLLNKDSLGSRYESLSQIKLRRSTLNQQKTIKIKNTGYFRTLLIKVPKTADNSRYAGNYVYILENIDSQRAAIQDFQQILIITITLFWLLAILLAYLLSRLNMRPILKSWHRQQEFVNDAAHELKTPLTVIQTKLEYLLTQPQATILSEAESISLLLSETHRLHQLTEELLTLARSDSQATQLNLQKTEMTSFLTTTLAPYQEIAASQDKHFETNFATTATLNIDRNRIRQLLIILIDNALKYTQANQTILVTANAHNTHFILNVTDTGSGIPEADQLRVFERFYRVDHSRTRATGGNGLGLSIAKVIVTEHHGEIKVVSHQPQGVTLSVKLPLN